jgi:protein arginine phosphatase
VKRVGCLNIFKSISLLLCSFTTYAQILFVCDANSARSYMAEQIATYFLFYPSTSRGLDVKSPLVDPYAVEALKEWNIDGPHTPQQLTEADIMAAEKVLTMTLKQLKILKHKYPHQKEKFEMLSICAGFPAKDISDPYGHPLSFYQKARDQIYKYEQVISANGWNCKYK